MNRMSNRRFLVNRSSILLMFKHQQLIQNGPLLLLAFSFTFWLFIRISNFSKIIVKLFPFSFLCKDLNLQPLDPEYSPITTSPGLPTGQYVIVRQGGFQYARLAV